MTDGEIGPNDGKYAAQDMSPVLANFNDFVIWGGVKRAFYQKYIDFNNVSGGAQVLTRDAQIQGVMFTSNNALVPANLNVFAKALKIHWADSILGNHEISIRM